MSPEPVALHGGGEFGPGDGPFLAAVLEAARSSAPDPATIRVAILPTAAARSRPDLAVANGRRAFAAAAATIGASVQADGVDVLERADADDPARASSLAGADLVYLVGGDPGHLLEVLDDTAAWRSVLVAAGRGAVVAGASAGAMVLGGWTWTPLGARRALGLVPGVAVLPHHDDRRLVAWRAAVARAGGAAAAGIGWVGLDEATGIVSEPGSGDWTVRGPGLARWYAPGATEPTATARDGGRLAIG